MAEAARKIIVDQGPERLTTEAISQAVGLSDGGIFRHFKNKNEIVLQVVENYEASLLIMISEVRNGTGCALDKLGNLFRLLLSKAERDGAVDFLILSWSLFTDNPTMARRAQRTVEMQQSVVGDFLRQGQTEGSVTLDINVERAASLFLNMTHGQVRWWTLRGRTFSLSEVCDDLWKLYRRAVQSAPPCG